MLSVLLSAKNISPHTASDLHVCNAQTHGAKASLVRDYLD